MTTSLLDRLLAQDTINFTLTNRIPRRWLTRVVGRISRAEHPLVRDVSLALWQRFGGDLHLDEALSTRFNSVHDCFIRALKPGARPVDPDPAVLVSPCDGIVGAMGTVTRGQLLQAKGSRYTLEELVGGLDTTPFEGGSYVTLRLTSTMYHRFHAPADLHLASTTFIPGDLWNVNPATVRRIPRLYCRNERAVLQTTTSTGRPLLLVAVGAVLVGSIHIHAVGRPLNQEYGGPFHLPCGVDARKGEELGYFHHGSTIIAIAG
ncbi:MAG: archaetidylserine decarboxylase, partial [Vicinamibacterales bacterium]